jgi:hypothetical protein
MSNMRRVVILQLILILMFGVILVLSAACAAIAIDIIIENQTEHVLTIYVNDYLVGDVKPGAQITREDANRDIGEYLIEAKNAQGEIVFSRTFTFETLQRINGRLFKVVIPPLQGQ